MAGLRVANVLVADCPMAAHLAGASRFMLDAMLGCCCGGLTGRGVKRANRSLVGEKPVLRRGDRIAWYEVRSDMKLQEEREGWSAAFGSGFLVTLRTGCWDLSVLSEAWWTPGSRWYQPSKRSTGTRMSPTLLSWKAAWGEDHNRYTLSGKGWSGFCQGIGFMACRP